MVLDLGMLVNAPKPVSRLCSFYFMLLQPERTRMSGNGEMKKANGRLDIYVLGIVKTDLFLLRAGSNVLVAGTAIFGAKDPKQAIQEMRTAVDDVIAQRK